MGPASSTDLTDVLRVFVWPPSRALEIEARADPEINLEKPKTILIEIASNENHILDGSLVLRPGSAGLRIQTSDATLCHGDGQNLESLAAGTLSLATLAKRSKIGIRVPIRLDVDLREIVVRCEVHYNTSEGEFHFNTSHSVPIQLPLGVNVQDVFKERKIFSKFAISCSTANPLQILNCQLEDSDDFAVTTPDIDFDALTVLSKQPLSMVYCISRKNPAAVDPIKQRKLLLQIDFLRLDERALAAARTAFLAELGNSDLTGFSRLLVPHLSFLFDRSKSGPNLEQVALLAEVDVPSYENCGWNQVLAAVPSPQRQALSAWLRKWHDSHRTLDISDKHLAGCMQGLRHHITVPVEVPATPVIYTAALDLLRPTTHECTCIVGEPILAELALHYSHPWSAQSESNDTYEAQKAFAFELDMPPDTWLVGGRRQARFKARAGEVVRFPILLVPQRPGRLLLPGVEVHPAIGLSESDGPDAMREGCPVDYVSQGETVLVFPGRREVGVWIGTQPSGEGWSVAKVEGREVGAWP